MSTRHRLLYLSAAEEDILAIVRFHAEKVGPASARGIYQAIQSEIGRLQDFPLMGPLHPDPELAALGYRKLVLNRICVAVYKLNGDVVTVYRVANGAADYPKLLK